VGGSADAFGLRGPNMALGDPAPSVEPVHLVDQCANGSCVSYRWGLLMVQKIKTSEGLSEMGHTFKPKGLA